MPKEMFVECLNDILYLLLTRSFHSPSHPSSQLLPVPTTNGLLHPDHCLCIALPPLPLDLPRTWFSSAHLLKLLPWRSTLPDSSGPPVPWLHCFIFLISLLRTRNNKASVLFGFPPALFSQVSSPHLHCSPMQCLL